VADHSPQTITELPGRSEDDVRALIAKHTEGRQLGLLGEPRVNVLELNLDLDVSGLIGTWLVGGRSMSVLFLATGAKLFGSMRLQRAVVCWVSCFQ
jgi:hypothetical protein